MLFCVKGPEKFLASFCETVTDAVDLPAAAFAVINGFSKAASSHMNVFLKAVEVDSFSRI